MDSPRGILLFLLLLFLLLAPDPQQFHLGQRHDSSGTLELEKYAVELLANSGYGDFDAGNGKWLNITGLREQDGFVWETFKDVQRAAQSRLDALLVQQQTVESGLNGSENISPWAADLLVYKNVTGLVKGPWVRSSSFTSPGKPRLNTTSAKHENSLSPNEYLKNITGAEGAMQIILSERTGEQLGHPRAWVREITARMIIQDEKSSEHSWDIRLRGVHFPEYGSIILTTTSEKFLGLFALPHFTFSKDTYHLAQLLVNQTISASIAEQESPLHTIPTYPWSPSSSDLSDLLLSTPSCEYIVYLQQHPLELAGLYPNSAFSSQSFVVMNMIEDELRFPNGAPMPQPPRMTMSALIFSPDCAFLLESKGPPQYTVQEGLHLRGWKMESRLRLANRYLTLFALLCGAQVSFLIRQMKESSTPSTVSRISFYSIAMMALGDGFACLALTVDVFVDAAFLTVTTAAFLASMCVSVFGMKFLVDIWTIQSPERRERQRQTATATSDTQASANPRAELSGPSVARTDILPLPVTARQSRASEAAQAVILPPDQDLDAAEAEDAQMNQTQTQTTTADTTRRETGALYTKFYLLLLAVIFLSLQAMSWPTTARSTYYHTIVFVYFSFWTPQIYRNVMRNCRKALTWEFVIGQSLLRLSPFVYVYMVPDNILSVEPDPRTAYALVGWVWLQVWALFSQAALGPRFFVPAGWVPSAYDYHPVLREDDLEDGTKMPLGFSQVAGQPPGPSSSTADDSTDRHKRTFDCAICMQKIDVPILPSGSSPPNDHTHTTTTPATTTTSTTTTSTAVVGAAFLARRTYMVTPCRHIFHTHCLEEWMRYRLQCPICRDALVPI